MPESDEQQSLRKQNEELRQSIDRAINTNSELALQLREALEGNKELQKQMALLQKKLDVLLAQTKKRNQKEYGPKTERHNPRPAPSAALERDPAEVSTAPAPRNHEKHILSQDLPVERLPHDVEKDNLNCPDCLVETVTIGHKVTYQLERILQTLKKIEHVQEVRACSKCRSHIVTAPKPTAPIPGSYVGPNLLAYTCVAKLAYGLPLYRQEKMHKREKARIPRSTQSNWLLTAGEMIDPLAELVKAEIRKSHCTKTDDTEIEIQDRHRKGTLRKGKMTVYIGDSSHPFIAFDFSPNQSFLRNNEFFQNYEGCIQADAASGFDKLFTDGTRIEIGCNAHSRRKYYEYMAIDSDDLDCIDVLDFYRKLYVIEDEIAEKTREDRLVIRQTRSKPLVEQLHAKVLSIREKYTPTNALMGAVQYTLNHWVALSRFVDDPDLDIDNNASERAIKAFVLSRKNFLFTGSDRGGKAIANLLTLIATCERLKIDAVEYLADVFSRINEMKLPDLVHLLPDRWKRSTQQKIS